MKPPSLKPKSIDPDMTMDEIMRRWPATIRVLIRHGMLCIGCPIGVFHTVTDACAAHEIDEEPFSRELLAAMQQDPVANAPSAFEPAFEAESAGPAGRRVEGITCGGGSQPPA